MIRRLAGALGALALASAGAAVIAAAPADAAACSGGAGVTVVVNADVRCDSTASGVAWQHFTRVGHTLTPVAQYPSVVCRIDGYPGASATSCADMPPADAYWALYWSDGTSGKWTYAQLGAASLTIPQGGSVALVWQGTSSRTLPSVKPPVARKTTTAPTATHPTKSASAAGHHSSTTRSTGASSPTPAASTPTPTTSADSATAARKGKTAGTASTPTPSASAGADSTVAGSDLKKTSQETSSGGSTPTGAIVGGAAVLLLGVGAFVVARRRLR